MSDHAVYVLMKLGEVHGVTDSEKTAEAWTSAGGTQVVVPLNEICREPYRQEYWDSEGEWIA